VTRLWALAIEGVREEDASAAAVEIVSAQPPDVLNLRGQHISRSPRQHHNPDLVARAMSRNSSSRPSTVP